MKKTALVVLFALILSLIAAIIYAQRTIWACSNHNPAHTATSTQEIKRLSQEYGCTGWHVIRR
jgi:hypothetical protein